MNIRNNLNYLNRNSYLNGDIPNVSKINDKLIKIYHSTNSLINKLNKKKRPFKIEKKKIIKSKSKKYHTFNLNLYILFFK